MTTRLQDWLSSQAQRLPDATAVVFQGQTVSYGALEQASNRLARALQAAGCARGDRVGLLLPKSPKALVAMFGVLKADCIYVPIDTASPPSRIERILELCECRCLLAEQSTARLLSTLAPNGAIPARILWMDGGANIVTSVELPLSWGEIESFSDAPVAGRSRPDDPAHILFTSGSTGIPKGVVITHSNVIHFVAWAVRFFGIQAGDRISGHPPLHFDLSTFDIYGTIAAGAQIHLLTPEISLLPHRLAGFIRDSELTQWFSVPSALLPLAKFDLLRRNDFPALRRLLWCGEKFPTPALMYWMRHLPHVGFVNLYGPTEATIASSYYRVPRCPADPGAEIPIGMPCSGELLFVLNEAMKPASPGEIGDLYIGGVGLSPGYWRDPAKTAEVFRRNPFSSNPGDRLYKTGDLARIGGDGMIYLVGRSDSQIKSRGHRIELGEIETCLHALAELQDAVVVALDSGVEEGVEIGCAYVPAPGYETTAATLKKQVAQVLPHYMIPRRWLALERMPHNGNGKTDRARIKQEILLQTDAGSRAAVPQTA